MADLIEKDEDIVIVEDESQLTPEAEDEGHTPEVEDEEDEPVQASEEDEDEDEDEREVIRERRRQEKKDRKERREQAIKRDKLELDFLRKRNDDLERRISVQEQRAYAGDLNAYDARIAQAVKDANMAEQVIAKAIEVGNGEDVAQALRYRDQARDTINQLSYQKQQAAQQSPKQAPPVDDLTLHYAQEFIKENPWYDVHGRNEDSAIVIAIDQSLAKDGYDPKSEEYWDELRKRAARRLPERFEQQSKETPRSPRGGPAVGSGKEHAPTSTRKEVYISPERKQALVDAGVWDDPVLRMKYVKRYAEYDRKNKS